MGSPANSVWRDHRLWVELFALFNITGLTVDIYLAHSMNFFREREEYIPFIVSLGAPLLLIPGLRLYLRARMRAWAILGSVVAWACIATGIAGVMLHLESSYFQSRTLASLVYSAPFAAPLAYTGLGLLLLMNRMVAPDDPDWSKWVLLLTLGGYVGNFVFSVTDHAQNGFYYRAEWVAVAASAFGVGFLFTAFVTRWRRADVILCALVMGACAIVGAVGFYFHVTADLARTGAPLLNRIVYGAPALAPLLFVDMGVLAFIGLAVRYGHTPGNIESTVES
jgi:hypothetical protein